ncbi:MAG: D-alanyl-D-alanine dipeptidase [Alphaproteobacteria bacterium]
MQVLQRIDPTDDIIIDLVYAREHNFTGRSIYKMPVCYVHKDTAKVIEKTVALLKPIGLKLKIFDAFRPMEAQQILWNICPDEHCLINPHVGSAHSRGVAIDATLADHNGNELDMGSHYDDFSPKSKMGCTTVSNEAQKNRFLLYGVMMTAGWDHNQEHQWWHFQLPNPEKYRLLNDFMTPEHLMP